MNKDIRQHLIRAGVANLREFGYPGCNEENIMADLIYSGFFRSMLEDNKGHTKSIDAEIDALLAELAKEVK